MMFDFLADFTINLPELKKQPYFDFKQPFSVQIDKKLSEMLVSGINPFITPTASGTFEKKVVDRTRFHSPNIYSSTVKSIRFTGF